LVPLVVEAAKWRKLIFLEGMRGSSWIEIPSPENACTQFPYLMHPDYAVIASLLRGHAFAMMGIFFTSRKSARHGLGTIRQSPKKSLERALQLAQRPGGADRQETRFIRIFRAKAARVI
jgi:hypothetical protein